MEINEDEPEDVRNATPVDEAITQGSKDERNISREKWVESAPRNGNKSRPARRTNKRCDYGVKIQPRRKIKQPCHEKMEILCRDKLTRGEYLNVLSSPKKNYGRSECRSVRAETRNNSTNRNRDKSVHGRSMSHRMEELAKPKKERITSLLENWGDRLRPEIIDTILRTLEENYVMSPEQMQAYYANEQKTIRNRRRNKRKKHECLDKEERKESCDENLDKEMVCEEYAMAHRFMKRVISHAKYSLYPPEEHTDLTETVLQQLGELLDFRPSGGDSDRRVQMMLLLANGIADWIHGLNLAVAEKRDKERLAKMEHAESEAPLDYETDGSRDLDTDSTSSGSRSEEEEQDEDEDEDEEEKEEEETENEEERDKNDEERRSNVEYQREDTSEIVQEEDSGEETREEPRGGEEEMVEVRGEERIDNNDDEAAEKDDGRETTDNEEERSSEDEMSKEIHEDETRAGSENQDEADNEAGEDRTVTENEDTGEMSHREADDDANVNPELVETDEENAREIRIDENELIDDGTEEVEVFDEHVETGEPKNDELVPIDEEEPEGDPEPIESLEEDANQPREPEEDEFEVGPEVGQDDAEEEEEAEVVSETSVPSEVEVGKASEIFEKGDPFASESPLVTFGKIMEVAVRRFERFEEAETSDTRRRLQNMVLDKLTNLIIAEAPDTLNDNAKAIIAVLAENIAVFVEEALPESKLELLRKMSPEVESTEVRNWAQWLASVTENATMWGNWIHETVTEAREKAQTEVTRGNWHQWTSDVDTEAIRWRVFNLDTKHRMHRADLNNARKRVVHRRELARRDVPSLETFAEGDEEEIETHDLAEDNREIRSPRRLSSTMPRD